MSLEEVMCAHACGGVGVRGLVMFKATTLHLPLSLRSSEINETATDFKKDLDVVSLSLAFRFLLFFSENPVRWFE